MSKSSIITDAAPAMTRENRHAPVHPGEILLEEFLHPLGISQYRLAKAMKVPPRRINEIVLGKRAVSGDTALRLGRALGTGAPFWMTLQGRYDMDVAADRLGGRLEVEVTPVAA